MLNLCSFVVPEERYSFFPSPVFLACGVIHLSETLGEIFIFIAKILAYLFWKGVLTFLPLVTDFILTNMLKKTSKGKVIKIKEERVSSAMYDLACK